MNSFGMQLKDILLQLDNAPVHKTYSVMARFERNDVGLEEQPPYSPDLNPIKHVWVELKKRLHQ